MKSPKYTPTSHDSFKALVYLVVSVRRYPPDLEFGIPYRTKPS